MTFIKANAGHPTYQPMIELGRAQKTTFLCRYLRRREPQREIEEGLNVIESWNRANRSIYYGKTRGNGLQPGRRAGTERAVRRWSTSTP